METTKLSSKGQVVLPKAVREQHGWTPGTEFVIESTPDGVRLRAKAQFPQTELGQVFGSVPHAGPAKTIEEMDAGVRTAGILARMAARNAAASPTPPPRQ